MHAHALDPLTVARVWVARAAQATVAVRKPPDGGPFGFTFVTLRIKWKTHDEESEVTDVPHRAASHHHSMLLLLQRENFDVF